MKVIPETIDIFLLSVDSTIPTSLSPRFPAFFHFLSRWAAFLTPVISNESWFCQIWGEEKPKIIDYNCHDKNIKKRNLQSKQFETLSEEILADSQDLPLHVFLLPTKGPNKRSWQRSAQNSKATWGPGSKSSSLRYGLRHRSRAARFQFVSLKVPGSLSIYSLQLT